MTWSGVGDVNVRVGGVVSTTNGNCALGSVGSDWLPLWSMITYPSHVIAAVIAGHRREQTVGPDVVKP